jgi:hypothetical protein
MLHQQIQSSAKVMIGIAIGYTNFIHKDWIESGTLKTNIQPDLKPVFPVS